MTETEISILVNRKSDIELIKQVMIEQKIQFPIYFFEYENHFQIEITSDYEEWELDHNIEHLFPGYEFVSDRERGTEEIRLQITRFQTAYSIYEETSLNQTKYLVKKDVAIRPERFNPEVKVLFGNEEQSYYINFVRGEYKSSGEQGFLLVNEFSKLCDKGEGEVLKDHLYKNLTEVVQYGYSKMQKQVESDFNDYADKKKRELKAQQKIPRKIIRDFVKACNIAQQEQITKNLAQDISFGKIGSLEEKYWANGIKEFEAYLKSPDQELCSKDYEIRTIDFSQKNISVRLRYLHKAADEDANSTPRRKYKRLQLEIKNDKITSIRLEDWY